MGQTADELRQEIDGKRQDATDKIEQLEQKVTGAADQVMQTKDQVKDQVMQVKEQVVDSVTEAKDQVVQAFDWRKQVDEKPLVALGAAFIGGVVLSSVLGGGDDDDHRGRYRSGIAPSYGNKASYASTPTYGAGPSYPANGGERGGATSSGGGVMASIRNAAKNSGFEDTLGNMASAFMATLGDRVKQVADETFPGMADKLQNAAQGKSDSGWSTPKSTAGQTPLLGGSSGTAPGTADYARTGELGTSLTNS